MLLEDVRLPLAFPLPSQPSIAGASPDDIDAFHSPTDFPKLPKCNSTNKLLSPVCWLQLRAQMEAVLRENGELAERLMQVPGIVHRTCRLL